MQPARALAWASQTFGDSFSTYQMSSVPMSCGLAIPTCTTFRVSVAIAAHCSSTAESHSYSCTGAALGPHEPLRTREGIARQASTWKTASSTSLHNRHTVDTSRRAAHSFALSVAGRCGESQHIVVEHRRIEANLGGGAYLWGCEPHSSLGHMSTFQHEDIQHVGERMRGLGPAGTENFPDMQGRRGVWVIGSGEVANGSTLGVIQKILLPSAVHLEERLTVDQSIS